MLRYLIRKRLNSFRYFDLYFLRPETLQVRKSSGQASEAWFRGREVKPSGIPDRITFCLAIALTFLRFPFFSRDKYKRN